MSSAAPAGHTVLVTGADGFLAGFIVSALRQAGWRVLHGTRTPSPADPDGRVCDFHQLRCIEDCAALLHEVDAVVNGVGILRERRAGDFEQIHHHAPLWLAQACVAAGVRQFVQISALGEPEDGPFIASKHRFDAALSALPLESVVLRPSVVYSTAGSYGGTSMLRALAATPGILAVPGDGQWRIQPVAAEDLAELVVRALERRSSGQFEVGGPQVLSLLAYQKQWRDWLRLPPARLLPRVPTALVGMAVHLGEWLGRGPLGATMWRMLRRGNVCREDARSRLLQNFDFAPRALAQVLSARPSQVQDRWHAQLHVLAPVLKLAVVALFLISAWVGWITPAAQIEQLTTGSLLQHAAPVPLARGAAVLDLLLGLGLLLSRNPRWAIAGMLLLVSGYTLVFGLLVPALWLDPLGGLAKNLLVLPALAVLWVLAERR